MIRTEDTISRAVEAAQLFAIDDDSFNRRNRRSGEPSRAVGFQFERVYDMVASEALVLCDSEGRKLSSVGDVQLCRMLSHSVPAICSSDRTALSYRLKGMDVVRPGIDTSHIAVTPIRVPKRRLRLYVASVSESQFNPAGVHHASTGVQRILGIPGGQNGVRRRRITSKDRLSYDVDKAMRIGFQELNASSLGVELRVPRRFRGPRRKAYIEALDYMLQWVDRRLLREGLVVDRPPLWSRLFSRDELLMEGYRNRRFDLPIRECDGRKRRGMLTVEMTIYERQFEIPKPPSARMRLN